MSTMTIAESKTERVAEIKQQPARLRCTGCGATTDAACACGVGYVPAHEYAAKAVVANPEMSDRVIAAELGVDHETVRRARKSVGEKAPTAKRIGKDGKKYPATKTKRHARPTPAAATPAVVSPIDDMIVSSEPEPTALLLSRIEQLVGDLALAVEHGARSDIFDGRVRAVADRLLTLITEKVR